jgi:stage III sporulation protein AG
MTVQPYDSTPAPRTVKSLKKVGLPALLCGIAGVVLILWGSHIFPGSSASTADSGNDSTSGGEPGTAYEVSVDTYRQALEDRMAAICAQVSGAGEVRVIVSLQGGFEYVYAYDEKVSTAGTSRVYVTVGSGSSQRLVFLTEKAPAITGIGVVCTGGADPTVRQEITSLLSAAFGIGTNRIYVTGRG